MPDPRSFCKRPLEYSELIEKLLSKGLTLDDPTRIKQHLKNIGYYRLVGYGLPFEQYSDTNKRLGIYNGGTEFDQLLNAYSVDRKLRILLLSALERIEVAVRNTINHTMSCKYQSHTGLLIIHYLKKVMALSILTFYEKLIEVQVKKLLLVVIVNNVVRPLYITTTMSMTRQNIRLLGW
jgi:abortive infection bacteriophage resistance protein